MSGRDTGERTNPLVAVGEGREWLDAEAYGEFARLVARGEPVALVSIIGTEGSAPRGMGAAMAVRADGSITGTVGGGQLELIMVKHALEALADGRPRRYRYDFAGGDSQNLSKACLGTTDFFVQPSPAPPLLYIFGAGHIGVALAPIAHGAGFRVTVVDERPAYASADRFPRGIDVVAGRYAETAGTLPFDERTFAVVVTHGHEHDETVLRACLDRPWRYLGMIGSQAKVARIFESLGTDDVRRKRLAAVRAPIGLGIGGRSPGEIAVSIAAEIIAVRHGREIAAPLTSERSESSGVR